MKELIWEDIDYLDQLGKRLFCSLYLPPFNDSNHPFFDITDITRANDLTFSLQYNGFSFLFKNIKDRQYIQIIGG